MLAVKKAKLDGPQGELRPLDINHFPTLFFLLFKNRKKTNYTVWYKQEHD